MSVETLAQALLEGGILDATSVEMRVPRARTGRQFLDNLIADGLVTESSLVTQLARALSVPRYDPKERSPEPDAFALLDARAMDELAAIPVALRGGGALLWVALCDPTDDPTLQEVARRAGRRVKPCLIGPRELAKALQHAAANPPQSAPQPRFSDPAATTTAQFSMPMPSQPSMPVAGYPMTAMMPNGLMGATIQGMPGTMAMPGMAQYYSYPGMPGAVVAGPQYQQMQAMQQATQPPAAAQTMQQPGMQQPAMPHTMQQPGMQPPPAPAVSQAPPGRSPELARLEEELAQAKQVVKVLAQLLVERNVLDGEELKRRLRAERERK